MHKKDPIEEIIITHSPEETKKLAQIIAKKILSTAHIVCLKGELGAGKTTFTQGFAKALNIKDKITSPTFLMIRHYKIPKTDLVFYHIDLYRTESTSSIQGLGFEEIIAEPKNIVLIEWAEKAEQLLPKDSINISLEILDGDKRKIKIAYAALGKGSD